ncbi:AMP-binding protein [Kineococcus gynurae]|uniref:AMP-binding protein n=1 Tax=Kineococcus gynurae TaxID=452979 RepID=A0ABV5LTP4_9ACTN
MIAPSVIADPGGEPRERPVRALPVPSGPAVLGVLPALAEALAGRGPVLRPCAAGAEGLVTDVTGLPDDPADPLALVVGTSGSTGRSKAAMLPAAALRASAAATAAVLDARSPAGDGVAEERWVLALPGQHVAGLQVLLRSLRAGTEPAVVDLTHGFDVASFVTAVESCGPGRLRTSLVPTQLVRLLAAMGADPGPGVEPARVLAALRRLDAVLVGAAATPPDLLERALAAGVAVVTTYGSSETCGGCVYDGLPLPGVGVDVERDGGDGGDGEGPGRLRITGPVLARGYLADPTASAAAFDHAPDGRRRFRTDDLADLGPDGRVRVVGRVDDLVVTGGVKVAPGVVEAVLARDPEVAEVVVVGVPDAEWGQVVAACVVPAPGARPDLAGLRARAAAGLPGHALPRRLLLLDDLPLRGPGKPDRTRLVDLVIGNTAGRPDVM